MVKRDQHMDEIRPARAISKREELKPEQRRHRNANRGTGDFASWDAANPVLLRSAINAIADNGYSVTFGYTRDGGAFFISIFEGDKPIREYVRPTEDINLYLTGLYEDYKRI